eukprot:Nk52_evm42s1705 gene=Nk52_evmTU42s1705
MSSAVENAEEALGIIQKADFITILTSRGIDLLSMELSKKSASPLIKPLLEALTEAGPDFKELPSRRTLPEFFEKISEPISLAGMGVKVHKKAYASLKEFTEDVDLMFRNCESFFPKSSEIAKIAVRLKSFFKKTLLVEYKKRLNGLGVLKFVTDDVENANLVAFSSGAAKGSSKQKTTSEEELANESEGLKANERATRASRGKEKEKEKASRVGTRNSSRTKSSEEVNKAGEEKEDEASASGARPIRESRSRRHLKEEPVETKEQEAPAAVIKPAGSETSLNTILPSHCAPMKEIIDELLAMKDDDGRVISELFYALPTKKQFPEYFMIIQKPIDIKHILKKILKGTYKDFSSFAKDCDLMFTNARVFNDENSQIYADCVALETRFNTLKEPYMPEPEPEPEPAPAVTKEEGNDNEEEQSSPPKKRRRKNSTSDTTVEKAQDTPAKGKQTQNKKGSEITGEENAIAEASGTEGLEDDKGTRSRRSVSKTPRSRRKSKSEKTGNEEEEEEGDDDDDDDEGDGDEGEEGGSEDEEVGADGKAKQKRKRKRKRDDNGEKLTYYARKKLEKAREKLNGDILSKFIAELKELCDDEGEKFCTAFLELPPKKDLPDYYKMIENPISLHEIEEKMESRLYETLDGFKTDYELMINNAFTFNENDSWVYKDAERLKDEFELFIKAQEPKEVPDSFVDKKRRKRKHEDEKPVVPSVDNAALLKESKEILEGLTPSIHSKMLLGVMGGDEDGDTVYAELFMSIPTEEELPEYYKVIKKPISLKVIVDKIKNEEYKAKDGSDFHDDMCLLTCNGFRFSEPESGVWNLCVKLENKYIEQCEKQNFRIGMKLGMKRVYMTHVEDAEGNRYAENDYCYLKNDSGEPHVVRIENMWQDMFGERLVACHWFYRVSETYHNPEKMYYEREVFKSSMKRVDPVSSIVGKCCVIHSKDYPKYKHKTIPDEHTYVCESKYTISTRQFRKLKYLGEVENYLEDNYDLRDEPVTIKRVPSNLASEKKAEKKSAVTSKENSSVDLSSMDLNEFQHFEGMHELISKTGDSNSDKLDRPSSTSLAKTVSFPDLSEEAIRSGVDEHRPDGWPVRKYLCETPWQARNLISAHSDHLFRNSTDTVHMYDNANAFFCHRHSDGTVYAVGDACFFEISGTLEVLLIAKIFNNRLGQVVFSGYLLLHPSRVPRGTNSRMRYAHPRELVRTSFQNIFDFYKMKGRVCVLTRRDFVKGFPVGFDADHTFFCETFYNETRAYIYPLKSYKFFSYGEFHSEYSESFVKHPEPIRLEVSIVEADYVGNPVFDDPHTDYFANEALRGTANSLPAAQRKVHIETPRRPLPEKKFYQPRPPPVVRNNDFGVNYYFDTRGISELPSENFNEFCDNYSPLIAKDHLHFTPEQIYHRLQCIWCDLVAAVRFNNNTKLTLNQEYLDNSGESEPDSENEFVRDIGDKAVPYYETSSDEEDPGEEEKRPRISSLTQSSSIHKIACQWRNCLFKCDNLNGLSEHLFAEHIEKSTDNLCLMGDCWRETHYPFVSLQKLRSHAQGHVNSISTALAKFEGPDFDVGVDTPTDSSKLRMPIKTSTLGGMHISKEDYVRDHSINRNVWMPSLNVSNSKKTSIKRNKGLDEGDQKTLKCSRVQLESFVEKVETAPNTSKGAYLYPIELIEPSSLNRNAPDGPKHSEAYLEFKKKKISEMEKGKASAESEPFAHSNRTARQTNMIDNISPSMVTSALKALETIFVPQR